MTNQSENTNTFIEEKAAYILPSLIKIVDTPLRERKKIIKGIASSIFRELLEKYPCFDEKGIPTYSTVRRQITAIRNVLNLKMATYIELTGSTTEISGKLKRCINDWFMVDLNDMYRPYSDNLNLKQETRRETVRQKPNRVKVDPSKALEFAAKVLEDTTKDEAESYLKWQDVFFALCLVTGRRSVEIMRTARFTKVDDYTVSFEGYAKQKDSSYIQCRNNTRAYYHFEKESFNIPTLVKADYVISGLDWLRDTAKGCKGVLDSANNNAEEIALRAKVNSRYSKAFTEHFKTQSVWNVLPDYETTIKALGLSTAKTHNDYKMSTHSFRGIYLRCCVVNEEVDAYDYMDFAQSILGDTGKDAVTSYQKFELVEGANTRV